MPWTATQVIDRSLPRPQQAPTCGCSGPPVLQRSPSYFLFLYCHLIWPLVAAIMNSSLYRKQGLCRSEIYVNHQVSDIVCPRSFKELYTKRIYSDQLTSWGQDLLAWCVFAHRSGWLWCFQSINWIHEQNQNLLFDNLDAEWSSGANDTLDDVFQGRVPDFEALILGFHLGDLIHRPQWHHPGCFMTYTRTKETDTARHE